MLPNESPFTNEADIKDLPHKLDGSFAWLTKTPRHSQWAIGDRGASKLPAQLKSIIASASGYGITLPEEFVTFIRTPALHAHLRSATACYLDVAETLLPFAEGFLIRFLADQQGCAFWYLYTNKDGSDHCVVSSLTFFGAAEEDDDPEDLQETEFQFEAFLSRFWLENEILFAKYDSTPPPDVDTRFLELYEQ